MKDKIYVTSNILSCFSLWQRVEKKCMKYLISALFFLSFPVYGGKSSFPLAIKRAEQAMVKIIIRDPLKNKVISYGSGFLMKDKDHAEQTILVTSAHVMTSFKRGKSLHLQTQSGKSLQFKRIRQLSFYPSDLAVLEVERVTDVVLKRGAIPNNEVYVLGFPTGQFRAIRGENIRQENGMYHFSPQSFDGKLKGMSGGPMLNGQGEVFGIVTSVSNDDFLFSDSNIKIHGVKKMIYGTPMDRLEDLLRMTPLPQWQSEDLIKLKMDHFKVLAEQGDAETQYILGLLLEEEDIREAERWFHKAMYQGHQGAQHKVISVMLYHSVLADIAEEDEEKEKFEQSLKRAQEGNANSQYYVGKVFLEGIETKSNDPEEYIDYSEARRWFTLAAQQGHASAECQLGVMSLNGLGANPDYNEAYEYFKRAAKKNNPEAQYKLGTLLLEEKKGWKQNPKEAIKWLIRAANQGEAILEADFKFQTSETNYEKAEVLRQMSVPYHLHSQYKLGTIFLEGMEGITPDHKEADKWLKRFLWEANKGDRFYDSQQIQSAQYKIGLISFEGLEDAEPDYEEAYKWFWKAADPYAHANKSERAILRIRPQSGHAESQYKLGIMFSRGLGVEFDSSKAEMWFSKAAKQGHVKAQRVLKRLCSSNFSGNK